MFGVFNELSLRSTPAGNVPNEKIAIWLKDCR